MRVSHNMHQNHLPCLKKKSVSRQVIQGASRGGLRSTYRVLASANRRRTDMGVVMMMLYMIPVLTGRPDFRDVHGPGNFPQRGNAWCTRPAGGLPKVVDKKALNEGVFIGSFLADPYPVG